MGNNDRRCSRKMKRRKSQAKKKDRIKRHKAARKAAGAAQTKKPRTATKPGISASAAS